MSESNIMHESTAALYHKWNMGIQPTGRDLVAAWIAAPEPEHDIPAHWWVARLREAVPGPKAANLVHLYRAATGEEVENGFMSMEWTTDRDAALTAAHKGLRVPVETVVAPGAILAIIGTEDGGTVLVDPWEIATIYLTEDVTDTPLTDHAPPPASPTEGKGLSIATLTPASLLNRRRPHGGIRTRLL
ncbi:hypothetical protein [Corynebacterium sp. AOP40-4SA-5]|uniref:hypothetical protein n=1 Tax=Corynebacterium sp. AOP40-4SA-5 TaxID=3457678 RepID=UPI0040331CC4